MLIKRRYCWDLAEHSTTDEKTFLARRKLVKAVGLFGASMGVGTFSKSSPSINISTGVSNLSIP